MQCYQDLTHEQLRQMYKTKGSLLLLDVPQGLEFGIDNILWKTGNKFKGLKFIPLGCHIISYTLKNENNMFKINKFILFSAQSPIQIYKWHQYLSIFIQLRGSQAQGYREGVKNYHFDSYLGPYPQQNMQFWRDNTCFISKEVLGKLDPMQKIYKFDDQYQKKKSKDNQQLKMDLDEDSQDDQMGNQMQILQEQVEQSQKTQQKQQKEYNPKQNNNKINQKFQPISDTIYYSEIPRKLKSDPEHINRVNLDKTQLLLSVIVKEWKHYYIGILGEIQYSFIYFLIGEDQDSFAQWKRLVNLLVFSEELFAEKQYAELVLSEARLTKDKLNVIAHFEKLALDFIVVLYNQLKQFPIDFFIDELSKGNFFQKCIKRLKQYCSLYNDSSQHISKKVKKRLQKLFKLLKDKFSFKIQEQEDDEEQNPQIVDYENESYF